MRGVRKEKIGPSWIGAEKKGEGIKCATDHHCRKRRNERGSLINGYKVIFREGRVVLWVATRALHLPLFVVCYGSLCGCSCWSVLCDAALFTEARLLSHCSPQVIPRCDRVASNLITSLVRRAGLASFEHCEVGVWYEPRPGYPRIATRDKHSGAWTERKERQATLRCRHFTASFLMGLCPSSVWRSLYTLRRGGSLFSPHLPHPSFDEPFCS